MRCRQIWWLHNTQMTINFIKPDWPAAENVCAFSTTRQGGVSRAPYGSFNLADHVGDSMENVANNRLRLNEQLNLPFQPHWLNQVHGHAVIEAQQTAMPTSADACYAAKSGAVCAVLAADCLPVLFCDTSGTCVAAAHAGWRGLAAGVLEATVSAMPAIPAELIAWLGPAIGPGAFEVGDEVRQVFVAQHGLAEACFRPVTEGKWLADIYALAQLRLKVAGVAGIYGGDFCTFQDEQRFYSYRRDAVTGRMASLIWLG